MKDYQFRQACARWHIKMIKLLKHGEIEGVAKLKNSIVSSTKEWEEQERIARRRVRELKSLLIHIAKEENLIKRGRKLGGK